MLAEDFESVPQGEEMPRDLDRVARRRRRLESHPVAGSLVAAVILNVPMLVLFVIAVSSNLSVVVPTAVAALLVSWIAGMVVLRRAP